MGLKSIGPPASAKRIAVPIVNFFPTLGGSVIEEPNKLHPAVFRDVVNGRQSAHIRLPGAPCSLPAVTARFLLLCEVDMAEA